MGQRATSDREEMTGLTFSAWSTEDEDGIQLAVFFKGFDNAEQVNEFLQTLQPLWGGTFIHDPPLTVQ